MLSISEKNIKMYYNILEHKNKYDKFITFGSGAEHYLEYTPYGLSKKVIYKSTLDQFNFYSIRIYSLFGEGELETRFIKSALTNYVNKKPIQIHRNKFMDFFYMEDFIKLIKHCIIDGDLPKEINCCYDYSPTLYDVAQIINNLNTYNVNINIKNWEMAPPFNGEFKDLGLKFIGLEQGIKNVYNKLKNEY